MRTASIFTLAAAISATLLPLGTTAATAVYTQSQNGTIVSASAVFNIAGDPGFTWTLDQDEQLWAYFTAPQSASFNQITWYGTDSDANFAVDFFPTTCFSCDASWVTTGGQFTKNALPNTGPFGPAQIQKTPLSGGIYAYSIDLAAPVTLTSGGGYALSVVNNYIGLPFGWAGSSVGSGFHLQYIVGQAMFLRAPGNLAFTLSDTTPAVPEPGSLWLLGLGALSVAAAARRRLKRGA